MLRWLPISSVPAAESEQRAPGAGVREKETPRWVWCSGFIARENCCMDGAAVRTFRKSNLSLPTAKRKLYSLSVLEKAGVLMRPGSLLF
jgi:hypothetical protein